MTRTNRTALVVFTGDARREERCKHLPKRFLETIHDHLATTLSAIPGSDLIIASSDDHAFQLTGPAGTFDRKASSLASQIDAALETCFGEGYARVVLLAGDVVDVTTRVVEDTITILSTSSARAVIGPSPDGGFYLAGFNQCPELDWESIIAEPDRSLRHLRAALDESAVTTILAQAVEDIDSLPDALRILSKPPSLGSRRLHPTLLGMLYAAYPDATSRPSAGVMPSPSERLRAPPLASR